MSVISNICVMGINDSIRASKYPMSTDISQLNSDFTERVNLLATSERGSGHDQFLTGCIVQFDLTFSIKAWVEAERYHFLDFVSSQSTMHRIARLDPAEQCNDYVDGRILGVLTELIEEYKKNPSPYKYLECLYNIPSGYRLTARMTTNYRQLKTIYKQRHDHRLPEWREFCQELKQLPHSEWITCGVKEDNDECE